MAKETHHIIEWQYVSMANMSINYQICQKMAEWHCETIRNELALKKYPPTRVASEEAGISLDTGE